MEKIQLAIMAAVLVMAVQARATITYDITFTGSDDFTIATGQFDVDSGIVTSGFLDVTFNGVTVDYNNLLPVGATGEASNGANFGPGQDNVFDGNSLTQGGFLTVNGLVFYSGDSYSDRSGGLIWLGDDSPSDPTPQLVGAGTTGGFGGYLVPYIDGTLTVSSVAPVPVPEASTMLAGALMLLPFGVGAVRSLRKERKA
jgi:hypothetical protein